MKEFIIRIGQFLLLTIFVLHLLLINFSGYVDPFYRRFTSSRQSSLILGSSRAAQAVQPKVLNRYFEAAGEQVRIYNYSFTINKSPFGPVYLSSIQEKLEKEGDDGIFIICVDPWVISDLISPRGDITQLRESRNALGEIRNVNVNPNLKYIAKYYEQTLNSLILKITGNYWMYLHDDGWLEIFVPMDSASMQARLEEKLAEYRSKLLPKFQFSDYRLEYLKRTINYLKYHGNVFLVRLPVHAAILSIEDELMPDFDDYIGNLSTELEVPYLNMREDAGKYAFTDGNHMHKSSGAKVSEAIAEWILSDFAHIEY
jgi:hypothetical protein